MRSLLHFEEKKPGTPRKKRKMYTFLKRPNMFIYNVYYFFFSTLSFLVDSLTHRSSFSELDPFWMESKIQYGQPQKKQ